MRGCWDLTFAELASPTKAEKVCGSAHERLLDVAIPFSGSEVAIEFPMSRYGPLQRVSRKLTEHIVAAVGPNSPSGLRAIERSES